MDEFDFVTEPYIISEHIKTKYNALKHCFHNAIDILKNYKNSDKSQKNAYKGAKQLVDFYDSAGLYMTVLVEEIFKEPLDKKSELFAILNKLLKMFFVYDILRHKHQSIFNDFSYAKSKIKDLIFVDKFTVFSAISMPMGHLFVSYFYTENEEIYAPRELCKRSNIFLCNYKMEHLFKIACITCKYNDYIYTRIFMCGLYNRFFQSGYFIPFIDRLDEQKQSYYVSLAEYQ